MARPVTRRGELPPPLDSLQNLYQTHFGQYLYNHITSLSRRQYLPIYSPHLNNSHNSLFPLYIKSMNPNDDSLFPSSKSPPSSFRPPGSDSDTPPTSSPPQLGYEFSTINPGSSSFPPIPSQSFPLSMGFGGSLSSSSPFDLSSIRLSTGENVSTVVPIGSGEVAEFATTTTAMIVPQPLDCLQGTPIPPFLSKTFDLVDDFALDPIISWGSTGESFVVWDPVEFARLILPRNFKHSNFSSFVRQLNTYVGIASTQPTMAGVDLYGFRKIDADRWEFANEGFLRGKRHLLKNIQRRKSPQAQQVGSSSGSSTEAGETALEGEIQRLKKERSLMMQEVIELQQQQRGTVQHMEAVNEKLQAAEQRQKQMVSFLAKLFQSPAFLARLQPKDHMNIASPRTMRKFVKHQQHDPVQLGLSMEGRIVKYQANLENLATPYVTPDLNPLVVEQIPDYLSQDTAENVGLNAGNIPFQIENIESDELDVAHELHKPLEQVGQGGSSLKTEDPLSKGKNVINPQPEATPEYFISYPQDLVKEKNFPDLLSPGFENMVRQEDLWSMGFEASTGMSSSSNELWGNISNYDMPELGVSGGLSDIWDLGFPQAAGGSGIEKCSGDELPFDELERQDSQPKDDSSKKMDP